MSNDLIKAAEEARKFVRSMQSLCAVADMLEDAGSVEQSKNETLMMVDKARAELAELKSECSSMKAAAEKTLEDAKSEAKDIVKNAIVERNQINAEVRSHDDSLKEVIAKAEQECRHHVKEIKALYEENEKLSNKCADLEAELKSGADAVKKAKAVVAALK